MIYKVQRTRLGGQEARLMVEESQLTSYDTLLWRFSTDLGNLTLRLPTYALIDLTVIDNERSEKKIVHYNRYQRRCASGSTS